MHCSASGSLHAGPARAGTAGALVVLQRRPVCSTATNCSKTTKKHVTARGEGPPAPAASARPASSHDGPPPPASSSAAVPASMQARYEQAYSMSQLYAKERPPPIPLEEHERRRRVKDVQEVVDVSGPRCTGRTVACGRVCLGVPHRCRGAATSALSSAAWLCRYSFGLQARAGCRCVCTSLRAQHTARGFANRIARCTVSTGSRKHRHSSGGDVAAPPLGCWASGLPVACGPTAHGNAVRRVGCLCCLGRT